MRPAPGRELPFTYRVVVALLRPPLSLLTDRHWRGAENLPTTGGFIAVSNHVTNLDPLTFAHFLVDNDIPVKFLAKSELFQVPVIGWLARRVKHIPVHRGSAKAAESLDAAREALQAGECVAIFPEGTLTHDPDMWPMLGKTGVARLALTTRVPVVPIAQWGAHRVIPRFESLPTTVRRQRVDVLALPPVDLDDLYGRPLDGTVLREATDRIMRRLTDGVSELRGEAPPERVWDRRVHGDGKAYDVERKAAARAERPEGTLARLRHSWTELTRRKP